MYFNIIILLILSGVLAYVGDVLGRKIGKMRISIPGLRPKTTAIVISIVTGMLITIVTLAVLTAISEEARIALFKIEEIRRDREELTKKLAEQKSVYDSIEVEYSRALEVLKDINESKEKLKAESLSLEKTLQIKKLENVVFQPEELLDYVVITSDSKPVEIEKQYTDMINRIKNASEQIGVKTRPFESIWGQLRDPLMETSKKLRPREELVVYLKTTQRVMVGEFLEDVKVQAEMNRTIYKKGQKFTFESPSGGGDTDNVVIDGSRSRELIKIELIRFFDKVRKKLKDDGMIIEPFSGFDSITMHDMINDIKQKNSKIMLSIEITGDVSIVGPFAFRIKFFKI